MKFSVRDISFGILGSLTDFLIWYTTLVGASFGKRGPRGVYQAFRQADKFLERVNHRTIATTWHQLFKKRLLTYKKRGNLYSPSVTVFGWKRLRQHIPTYHTKRPWDGKIYLITYDVPEEKSRKRHLLRQFLRKIGASPLQESVWLTPYNPRELLHQFVKGHAIEASIIVSDVGKDGGVGETNIQDLLLKVYKLESINERYERFIEKVKAGSFQKPYLLLEYLSILKDDPQLPFELLPKGWLGTISFQIYQSLLPKGLDLDS